MRRLLHTIRLDIRLQIRNGFYYAAATVVVITIFVLKQIPGLNLSWLFPALILNNLHISTFYFFAALVLLEKGEQTLQAQVVTPLRDWEYLASKVVTLVVLAVVENLTIVLFTHGLELRIIPLILGATFCAASYALLGFIAVARYDSINEFLFGSFVYVIVLSLPIIPYFDIWTNPIFYLHPFWAALLLMKAGFLPIPIWQAIYALVYSALALALLYRISRRVFRRFIIVREGIRPA